MPQSRPPYAPEFRRQMIDLVVAGRTPEELAKEFEPSAQTIRNWVAQAERDAGRRHDGPPRSTADPAKPSTGKRRPRRSINYYPWLRKPMLRRPLEPKQYTGLAFGQRCREAGVRPSMGSVGDCYDNAMAESFFATLECELLDRYRFRNPAEARMAVFRFIEGWYTTRIGVTPQSTTYHRSTTRGNTLTTHHSESRKPSTETG